MTDDQRGDRPMPADALSALLSPGLDWHPALPFNWNDGDPDPEWEPYVRPVETIEVRAGVL